MKTYVSTTNDNWSLQLQTYVEGVEFRIMSGDVSGNCGGAVCIVPKTELEKIMGHVGGQCDAVISGEKLDDCIDEMINIGIFDDDERDKAADALEAVIGVLGFVVGANRK
jgi:hypothetical protein